ncbi:MAG: hypothetical protein HYV05_08685 [Deltaproteobacteria bacterium]|nr:hypothetical protein [Deltaproteobacteria bacterium]
MRDELLRQTRRLREHERSSEEKELFDTLLDVMILDSEKHERLLAAIERMVMA